MSSVGFGGVPSKSPSTNVIQFPVPTQQQKKKTVPKKSKPKKIPLVVPVSKVIKKTAPQSKKKNLKLFFE